MPEHPVLARDKVCYVGQPVAIAVAHDRYLAVMPLDLIEGRLSVPTAHHGPLGGRTRRAPFLFPRRLAGQCRDAYPGRAGEMC